MTPDPRQDDETRLARIAQIRDDIATNRVPGGSAYGRAAAELIRLSVADSALNEVDDIRRVVQETGEWATRTKPSMATVRNVANMAVSVLNDPTNTSAAQLSRALIEAMNDYIDRSTRAVEQLGAYAPEVIAPGTTVLVHSYSASLKAILRFAATAGIPYRLLVTESRPYRESRRLVEALESTSIEVTLFSDAAAAIAVERCDMAIVGADTLFRDGSFANKTGSLPIALACSATSRPYYVATELGKLYPGDPGDVDMELRPAEELAADWDLVERGRVTVWNQFFERVESRYVHRYITELGLLEPEELARTLPVE